MMRHSGATPARKVQHAGGPLLGALRRAGQPCNGPAYLNVEFAPGHCQRSCPRIGPCRMSCAGGSGRASCKDRHDAKRQVRRGSSEPAREGVVCIWERAEVLAIRVTEAPPREFDAAEVRRIFLQHRTPHWLKTSRGPDDLSGPRQTIGDKGFEPLLTESESVVLPLHQSPKVGSCTDG